MQIKTVRVIAGRTVNHPHQQYANLRQTVEMVATVSEGEDAEACVKELQGKVERLVEDHKNNLLRSIEELRELSSMRQEMNSLESSIRRGQERLEELRKTHPGLNQLSLPMPVKANSETVF
jgi:hypothetical protein